MSRAKRRGTRGSARSRRVPARARGAGGPQIPWIPVIVVVGVIAVGGLIAFLIWQQSQPSSASNSGAVRAEADADPALPGEYIDLPEIYGGPYPDTAGHVRRQVDYVADGNSNPPAGGPHWGQGSCPTDPDEAPPFCGPAPWGIYRKPWEPATLVHNMEHGGSVVWYNTTDQEVIADLEDLIEGRLNRGELIVMSPYPDMEDDTIALTYWSRLDKFPVGDYTRDRVEVFLDTYECHFDPEDICRR